MTAHTNIYAGIDAAARNRAAERFDLTEAQYNALADGDPGFLEMNLADMLRAFDFDRRQIIGVPYSLAPIGEHNWHQQWNRWRDHHMRRAWAAFAAAEDKWGEPVSRAETYIPAGAAA